MPQRFGAGQLLYAWLTMYSGLMRFKKSGRETSFHLEAGTARWPSGFRWQAMVHRAERHADRHPDPPIVLRQTRSQDSWYSVVLHSFRLFYILVMISMDNILSQVWPHSIQRQVCVGSNPKSSQSKALKHTLCISLPNFFSAYRLCVYRQIL